MEDYGVILEIKDEKLVVQKLDWKSLAKKSGLQNNDIISNLKVENLDRPNKMVVFPAAFLLLLIFGYSNYKRK